MFAVELVRIFAVELNFLIKSGRRQYLHAFQDIEPSSMYSSIAIPAKLILANKKIDAYR